MSSKGRDRPQRHQNATKWDPDKFKTDPTTKRVQGVIVINCCERCTSTIEWKIKYGKYKPLSQPAKCTRCSEKRVKAAYHTVCGVCVEALKVCAKCGAATGGEAVRGPQPTTTEEARLQAELQRELKALPERKRRTILRCQVEKEKIDS